MKTLRILSAVAVSRLCCRARRRPDATAGDRKDLQVFKDVAKSVNATRSSRSSTTSSANVKDGVVTLTGKVTMPYKRNDIEKRVAKVDGVREVSDEITVLPVSQFDDELRYRIARVDLQQLELLELRDHGEPADPHRRRARPGHADRRGAEQCRSHAGALAGDAVRRVLGHERAEDRRRGPRRP